eukprot:scaffold91535_cov26-Attheya_sp.AAC.2
MPVILTSVRDSSLPAAVSDINGFLLILGVADFGRQLRCMKDLVEPESNKARNLLLVQHLSPPVQKVL